MQQTRRPWTSEEAQPLVAAAAAAWGLDGAPELLRLGTNASYRVGDAVVRVAPETRDRAAIDRELHLAAFLEDAGVPAVRPLAGAGPVRVEDRWATAWEWVAHDPRDGVGGEAFGALLRRFHDATAAYDAALPDWGAPQLVAARLRGLRAHPAFSDDEVDLLERALAAVEADLAALGLDPHGVVHGDAHPGNVLHEAGTGRAVLADFDLIGVGPRAWDLAPAALHPRRYGADPSWWEAVRRGYDRPEDPSWDVCLRLRELASAAWLFAAEDPTATDAVGRPRRSAEADVRMRTFTGDPEPPVWGRH